MSACSKDTNVGNGALPVQGEEKPVEEKEVVQEESEEESSSFEIMNEIDEVTIPMNLDDFTSIEAGLFTKDLEIGKETSIWPISNPLSGFEEDFIKTMEEVTASNTDEDVLLKSFIHLLGNSAYPEVISKLSEYEFSFSEPLLPDPELNDTGRENQATPERALILLDASSSMLLDANGKQRMKIAKDAVLSFGKTIGTDSDIALYVYGHAGSQEDKDMELSCTTIDEVYPVQPYEEESFFNAVQDVEAKGWTPLAAAIGKAREDSAGFDGNITLYIVSDGMETCNGNPVEAAKGFSDEKEGRHVNIIGFNVDKESEGQLKEVAAAGNGEYISANSQEELEDSMKYKWLPDSLDLKNKSLASPRSGFAVPNTNHRLDSYKDIIQNAINKETERFQKATGVLGENELLSNEEEEAFLKRIEEYKKTMERLKDELREAKRVEMDAELDRIDNNINEWIEKMEKLKKENS